MKKFLQIYFLFLIVLTLVILTFHTFSIGNFVVDNISIFLIIVLALLPFVTSIKKFKWGDFEAEIDSEDVNKIKESVDNTISKGKSEKALVPKTIKGYTEEEVKELVDYLIELSEIDPVLAIAKLRVELERLLRGIYLSQGGDIQKSRSLGYMISFLVDKKDFKSEELDSAKMIIDISNRVVHGENIDNKKAKIVVLSAIRLLNYMTGYSKALDEFGMLNK